MAFNKKAVPHRNFKENAPNGGGFTPKKISEAVDEFLAAKKSKTSERRQKTNKSYLNTLKVNFPDRCLHEVGAAALEDVIDRKDWAPKTRNDFLGTIGLFYRWSIKRGYAGVNPASAIERSDVKFSVGIFTPDECRRMLGRTDDELKPFLSLWCFTGLRAAEIARLTWEQVNQGLASGHIYLEQSQSKTRARSVLVRDNLRCVLVELAQ